MVKMNKLTSKNKLILWGLSTLLLLSCAPEQVKQYRVAKSAAQPVAADLSANHNAEALKFKPPAGWEQEAASGMRLASFRIAGGGDVSVVTLPGAAGDLQSNVNRWRGQVGLPPLQDPQAIAAGVQKIQVAGVEAIGLSLFAPEGTEDRAMQVALFEKDGINWFFKLAGPRELVKTQAQAFEAFLQSVQIQAPAAQAAAAPLPSSDPHSDRNAMMDSAALMPQATETRLSYELPASWNEKTPTTMRVASFEVKAAELTGDVSIVSLAGDGGGLLSNTNRWRQQLEMAPTDQEGLKNSVQDIDVAGHKGYFMALYTGLEGNGMLVALVEQGGQTWFIKMTAPSQLAQAQEQDFLKFVRSIRFHAKGEQT